MTEKTSGIVVGVDGSAEGAPHIHRRIVCDQPARWLVDAPQQAQLVVLGSHGRGGFTGLVLGSIAAKVAHAAAAPVIVVRPR